MILRLSWFPVGPQVSDWGPDEVKEYYNLKYRDTVRCIKREADIQGVQPQAKKHQKLGYKQETDSPTEPRGNRSQ